MAKTSGILEDAKHETHGVGLMFGCLMNTMQRLPADETSQSRIRRTIQHLLVVTYQQIGCTFARTRECR